MKILFFIFVTWNVWATMPHFSQLPKKAKDFATQLGLLKAPCTNVHLALSRRYDENLIFFGELRSHLHHLKTMSFKHPQTGHYLIALDQLTNLFSRMEQGDDHRFQEIFLPYSLGILFPPSHSSSSVAKGLHLTTSHTWVKEWLTQQQEPSEKLLLTGTLDFNLHYLSLKRKLLCEKINHLFFHPAFQNLHTLNLTSIEFHIIDDLLRSGLEKKHFTKSNFPKRQLKHLNLNYSELTPESLTYLMRVLDMQGIELESLSLRGNHLSKSSLTILLNARSTKKLHHLDLSLNPEAAKALIEENLWQSEGKVLTTLTSLNLSSNHLQASDFMNLTTWVGLKNLQTLNGVDARLSEQERDAIRQINALKHIPHFYF